MTLDRYILPNPAVIGRIVEGEAVLVLSEQGQVAARIFAVADIWDAMRSDRPYRQGWPEEKVCEHIRSLASTHFDPRVVEVFMEMEW